MPSTTAFAAIGVRTRINRKTVLASGFVVIVVIVHAGAQTGHVSWCRDLFTGAGLHCTLEAVHTAVMPMAADPPHTAASSPASVLANVVIGGGAILSPCRS